MSELYDKTYNPDVLSCLANLSNDEVFTPPEVANQMLDMLPKEIWSDPHATFLDPACKSGVFLREIAKRLIKGLEKEFPDLDERLEHIFKKQLHGVAITELTKVARSPAPRVFSTNTQLLLEIRMPFRFFARLALSLRNQCQSRYLPVNLLVLRQMSSQKKVES